MYKSSIRPVAEYAAAVFHPMLTDEQSKRIERQQNQALKFVFGHKISASKMRKKANIDSLQDRRKNTCAKFAKKTQENPRFKDWFPERPAPAYERRKEGRYRKFEEKTCKTQRCFNSPLYYYRRVLNGAEQ